MHARVSIRELNANVSAALARVEAGERLVITKNGKPIAELSPPGRPHWREDPERRAIVERGLEIMRQGIPGFGAPATYEERTSRKP
jgi:prevent-host-death family protein